MNKFTYEIFTEYISHYLLNDNDLENILIITKNKYDEIVMVDFDLKKAYEVNNKVTSTLNDKIKSMEIGIPLDNNLDISGAKNGFQINVPLFIGSNYTIISNMGPKIPIKIAFLGSVETNLRTSVANYGLNNSLAEIYVRIIVVENIITPIQESEMKFEYEILLDSKLVQGRIPYFYGDSINKESNILK